MRPAKPPAAAEQALGGGEFAELMEATFAAGASWPGAVAVSGGADSIALMVLLADWARAGGRQPPQVLTVDHGLNSGSADVANDVLDQARALGLPARALCWRGNKPFSDIESAAREARYRLLGQECARLGLATLYVAHILEDQAETFLVRLARGSGVDGLSAMTAVAPFPQPGFGSLRVVRPLLTVHRSRLRTTLLSRGMSWQEDPMNADPRFARVRLRTLWPDLERAGISARRIADAARHLARARVALEEAVAAALREASRIRNGAVLLDGARLAATPDEIALRILAAVLMQVSGQAYRPRFERLERLLGAIRTGRLGKGRTLHGCCIRPAGRTEQCFGPQTLSVGPELRRLRQVPKRGGPRGGGKKEREC